VFGKSIGQKCLSAVVSLPLMFNMTGGISTISTPPDPIDNMLRFEELTVYKYDGFQPYDVVARVVDGNGDPATHANVKLLFIPLSKASIALKELKDGYYIGCDVETLDMPSGKLQVTAAAAKRGFITAQATASDQPGNACGGGESQLFVSTLEAAKPDGEMKSLDMVVHVSDETGSPVQGASVLARITDFNQYVDVLLTDMGGGKYMACSVGAFNSTGVSQLSIHVQASAKGYRQGAADGTNQVGTICSRPVPSPNGDPSDVTSDTPASAEGDGRNVR
jgi:hypothetical protein